MEDYKKLIQEREALEQRIKAARQDAISGAIAKIQSLIAEFELTPQDVFPPARSRSTVAGTKVAPKYCDPATGQTWTGRGKPPKWIQGQDRAKFAI